MEKYEWGPEQPVIKSIVNLLRWNPSHWKDFALPNDAILDKSTRVAKVVQENQVIWSEQIITEFEILLEIAVLMSTRKEFDTCNLEEFLYEGKKCGFGLPRFPSQRLRAVCLRANVNLRRSLDQIENKVRFLWITFFVSICKFPRIFTSSDQELIRIRQHPLIPMAHTDPCQLPSTGLLGYFDSIEILDMDGQGDINNLLLVFVKFVLNTFLKTIALSGW